MNDNNKDNKTTDNAVPAVWTALYDIADELKNLEPWEFFCAIDLEEIYIERSEEPYYCSFSGMFEEPKGVSMYIGHSGLVSLSGYINAMEMPEYVSLSRKNCLECTWGSRKDLKKKDLEILKSTGHKYRGAEAWPLFRKFETGYDPWYLTEEEAEIMVEVLTQAVDAINELRESGELYDLSEGDRIRRRYDKVRKTWVNDILAPVERIEAVTDGCVITDELLIRRLKKKPVNGTALEFDMPYLPVPVKGKNKEERSFYPRMCLICDAEAMKMESQYFVDRFEDPRDVALGMMVGYMEEKGRPATIYVRDAEMYGILAHLCSNIGTEIFFTPTLHMLDYFVQEIILAMTQK